MFRTIICFLLHFGWFKTCFAQSCLWICYVNVNGSYGYEWIIEPLIARLFMCACVMLATYVDTYSIHTWQHKRPMKSKMPKNCVNWNEAAEKRRLNKITLHAHTTNKTTTTNSMHMHNTSNIIRDSKINLGSIAFLRLSSSRSFGSLSIFAADFAFNFFSMNYVILFEDKLNQFNTRSCWVWIVFCLS